MIDVHLSLAQVLVIIVIGSAVAGLAEGFFRGLGYDVGRWLRRWRNTP